MLTGATGFIGSHLLPFLTKDFNVTVVCRATPAACLSGVEYQRLDLLHDNPEYLEWRDFEALVHLAWGLPHYDYWKHPLNALWLKRSIALTKCFLAHGGKHVHVAGTCAEYDWTDEMPLREDQGRLHPRELYGKCKNALRAACDALCARAGATLGWYRIFWPYGPGQDEQKFIPSLIRALGAGQKIACNSANLERDYIHVTDAARLLAMAINQNFSGILNIGSGNSASLGGIARKIAAFFGNERLLAFDVATVTSANPQKVVADVSAQKRIAGYSPLYDLDSGIAALIKYLSS